MEKFSAWRDKASGVHPFLPPSTSHQIHWPHVPIYLLALPIRVALLLVVLLWSGVMLAVAALLRLQPVRGVSRGFERYVLALGCRVALLLLAFHHIRSDVVSLRRSSAARRGDSAAGGAVSLAHGDVVVCNHASFVDLLYFAFRYGASFAFPARHWPAGSAPPTGVVLAPTIFHAFLWSFAHVGAGRSGPLAAQGELFRRLAVPIGEASERAHRDSLGPIVLFAEACVSNGRAVLPFVPVLARAALPPRARVHVMALKYAKEGVAHEFVVRDSLAHVLWLAAQPHNALTVLRLVADEQPSLADAASSHDGVLCDALLGAAPPAATDDGAAAGPMALSTRLAGLLRVRRVAVSCADKHAFDDKWLGRSSEESKKSN